LSCILPYYSSMASCLLIDSKAEVICKKDLHDKIYTSDVVWNMKNLHPLTLCE